MTAHPLPSRPLAPRYAIPLVLAFIAVAPGGCKSDPPQAVAAGRGTVDVKVGTKTFHLWIAATEADRERGLMNRPSLPADGGMVFVFRGEEPLAFWMKNTLIPLDLIYLDAGGRVVSIKQGKPLDETNIPSDGPARFTIELNVGAAAGAGLKPGDQVTLPAEVLAPRNLE